MVKDLFSLEVLVHGKPVQEYHKQQTFVEGRCGTEYGVRLRNNSWKRVMAVLAVDGVDVIGGRAAAESDEGYILEPYSSMEVRGYRIDESSVAAFRFGDTEKSYANEVGAKTTDPSTGKEEFRKTTANNGTIGVRFFEDKNPRNPLPASISLSGGWLTGCLPNATIYASGCIGIGTSAPAAFFSAGGHILKSTTYTSNAGGTLVCDSSHFVGQGGSECVMACNVVAAPVPTFDIGTTWGQKTQDKVRKVAFDRSDTFTELVLFYASRPSLERWGIDFSNTKQYFAWPSAFEDRKQFCKPPAWYKG